MTILKLFVLTSPQKKKIPVRMIGSAECDQLTRSSDVSFLQPFLFLQVAKTSWWSSTRDSKWLNIRRSFLGLDAFLRRTSSPKLLENHESHKYYPALVDVDVVVYGSQKALFEREPLTIIDQYQLMWPDYLKATVAGNEVHGYQWSGVWITLWVMNILNLQANPFWILKLEPSRKSIPMLVVVFQEIS